MICDYKIDLNYKGVKREFIIPSIDTDTYTSDVDVLNFVQYALQNKMENPSAEAPNFVMNILQYMSDTDALSVKEEDNPVDGFLLDKGVKFNNLLNYVKMNSGTNKYSNLINILLDGVTEDNAPAIEFVERQDMSDFDVNGRHIYDRLNNINKILIYVDQMPTSMDVLQNNTVAKTLAHELVHYKIDKTIGRSRFVKGVFENPDIQMLNIIFDHFLVQAAGKSLTSNQESIIKSINANTYSTNEANRKQKLREFIAYSMTEPSIQELLRDINAGDLINAPDSSLADMINEWIAVSMKTNVPGDSLLFDFTAVTSKLFDINKAEKLGFDIVYDELLKRVNVSLSDRIETKYPSEYKIEGLHFTIKEASLNAAFSAYQKYVDIHNKYYAAEDGSDEEVRLYKQVGDVEDALDDALDATGIYSIPDGYDTKIDDLIEVGDYKSVIEAIHRLRDLNKIIIDRAQLKMFEENKGLVERPKGNPNFSKQGQAFIKSTDSTQHVKLLADRLASQYNIDFKLLTSEEIADIYDDENGTTYSNARAFTIGSSIVINSDYASIAEPLHELGHFVLLGLKQSDPDLYLELMNAVRSHPRFDDIALHYPELTGTDLDEEVFTTVFGENYRNVLKSEAQELWEDDSKSLFGRLMDNIKQFFRRLFNIDSTDFMDMEPEEVANMSIEDVMIKFGNDMLQGHLKKYTKEYVKPQTAGFSRLKSDLRASDIIEENCYA